MQPLARTNIPIEVHGKDAERVPSLAKEDAGRARRNSHLGEKRKALEAQARASRGGNKEKKKQ